MDPSGAQHPQEMGTQTLESMLVCTKTQQEKKPRPQPEQALKCPRCDSTNTKFCYYNNYSLSQPRYFCKSCRRYWTKGGTLRNVPVGGGCRKNRRSSSSSSSSSKRTQDQPLITMNHPNPLSALPSLPYDSNDLSLAFARLHNQPTGHLGFDDHEYVLGNPNVLQTSATPALFDALRSGFLEAPNGFHNLGNYEMGNIGNLVENRVVGPNASEEMAMAYEDVAMKQEVCSNGREGERGAFWGFPWQVAAGDGNMGDLDLGRESWNGIGSWHGLLNSPLM